MDTTTPSLRLSGGWLALARGVWLGFTLLVFGLWAWEVFGFQRPSLAEAPFFIVAPLGYFAIAAVVFARRSADAMGLLVSLMLVFLGPYLLAGTATALMVRSGWEGLNLVLETVGLTLVLLFFALFPDGRFVPRWRRVGVAIALAALVGALINRYAPVPDGIVFWMFSLLLVPGLLAQVYRYRRVSTPAQRQQTKWVVVGFVGPVLTFFWWLFVLLPARLPVSTAAGILLNSLVTGALLLCLPIAIAVAVLRYRLFDIDRWINRTLVYGSLTVALALVYFGSVVLLEGLVRATAGRGSEMVIVASTLAIAALFNPLRRRIQGFIDRRFYRHQYNAQQTLATFAAALRADTNADLDHLTGELLSVIQETMQPTHVSLWLREPRTLTAVPKVDIRRTTE